MKLNIGEAFYTLRNGLSSIYDDAEAQTIAHEVLEHVTGMSRLQRLSSKDEFLSDNMMQSFLEMQEQLTQGRPMQYVLGYAWFCNMKFRVDERVLIPRPETEELVQWVIQEAQGREAVIDIGTGSGCIAISLKRSLVDTAVAAMDISAGALALAKENAAMLGADITFIHDSILQPERLSGSYDIIVSNPPYIPPADASAMHRNVLEYEPHMALFTPDDDALIFYKAIARAGKNLLSQGGCVYMETHRDYAHEVAALFFAEGYATALAKKDMHSNDRMVKGIL